MKIFVLSLMIALITYSCFSQNEPTKKETLVVKRDSVFTVRLGASFGEGYSWRLVQVSDTSCVKFLKMSHLAGIEGKDGAPEIQLFHFRGAKNGISTLHFVYEQPWLKEKSPKLQYKSYSIIIN